MIKSISFISFLLAVLADNGRLKNLDSIAKKFVELTMAHRGEVKAVVTAVIVSFSAWIHRKHSVRFHFDALYVFLFLKD